MKLRAQIVSRFAALPLIFAVVVVLSGVLVQSVQEELVGVSDYHLPIAQLVSDLDVATFDYELTIGRALRRADVAPPDPAKVARQLRMTRERVQDDIGKAHSLLKQAVADERNGTADRLVLAQIHGTLDLLARSFDPFLAVGDQALEALAAGEGTRARELAAGFAAHERTIGSDLASVRAALSELETSSVEASHVHLATLLRLCAGLFVVAALLGLWLGTSFATGLVARLALLLGAARKVAEGSYEVALPAPTPDEAGDLATAFDGMVQRLREHARNTETFGRFFDPRIVAHVLASGVEPGEHAERRTVTVLFSDIAGFTGISETLTAEVLVRLLNRVFTDAASAIQARGGIVDKYIGDAVMAFFTPPFTPGDSHAAAACLAALEIDAALERLAPELPALIGLRRGVPRIEMRSGITTGEVVIGTVGSPTARSFTAIGDAVNAASRLTGVNKVYGTRQLISGETWRLAQQQVDGREIDHVLVSGKSEPVVIYEVMGRAGELSQPELECCERYGKALEAYRLRDFAEAERGFAACLAVRPDDGPARLLQQRCAQLQVAPPPEDWDGVWYLTAK